MDISVMDIGINDFVNKLDILKKFSNNNFFITGSTGLIGSQLVKLLLETNKQKNYNINVYAFCRNKNKAIEIFDEYLECKYFHIIEGDIKNKIKCNGNIDYIIHGASVTQSRDFVKYPVETIQTSLYGTENVLNFAREKHIKKMVYLSSLEVYGQINLDKKVKENDYGYIDILNPRSSYSESKRMSETLCCSYFYQYGVDVTIARLAQTFGAGVDYNDTRVFAQFARSIIEGKDIVLHTKGKTERNYIYIHDAISALFYILLYGSSGEAYNVANEETGISIYDMANKLIARYGNGKIKVVIDESKDIKKLGYNPETKTLLDTSKLRKLGWNAEVGLMEMYGELIKSLINNK